MGKGQSLPNSTRSRPNVSMTWRRQDGSWTTVSTQKRHGKFVDLGVDGLHLVVHLAKAGWLRWSDRLGDKRLNLGNGRSPCGCASTSATGRTYRLADGFELAPVLDGRRMQVKRLLRDQMVPAGISNAYSDEILHAARMSPFAIAADLDAEQVTRLAAAIRDVLEEALAEAHGKLAAELKDDKGTRMRVHGRAGETCPVCRDTVAEVVFADSSLQPCPACQTGGKQLKDRSTSRFLK